MADRVDFNEFSFFVPYIIIEIYKYLSHCGLIFFLWKTKNIKDANDQLYIAEIFRQNPEIEVVYLFGSIVTETIHSESDLDLAVILRNQRVRDSNLDILEDFV